MKCRFLDLFTGEIVNFMDINKTYAHSLKVQIIGLGIDIKG